MVSQLAFTALLLAAAYLLVLGVAAITQPDRARRFLGSFASSARIHFVELTLRFVCGVALLITAPSVRAGQAFRIVGWILIGSTVVLAVVPWRFHQRFASSAVPIAGRYMLFVGAGAIVGGLILLGSLTVWRSG